MCNKDLLLHQYDLAFLRMGISSRRAAADNALVFEPTGDDVYVAFLSPEDPAFVRVTCGFQRSARMSEDGVLLRAANATNTRVRCAKLTVGPDTLVSAAELLVAAPSCLPTVEHLCAVLPRAIDLIRYSYVVFDEEFAFAEIAAAERVIDRDGSEDTGRSGG